MGRTMAMVKMWNIMDEEKIKNGQKKPLEIESQVDNGSVRVVLPKKIAKDLNLKSLGKTKVRYADMRIAEKEVVYGLMIELLGRITETTAIVEPERDIPLIGQIVLEDLDLLIDSKNGKLIPNPESPDMPLIEMLGTEDLLQTCGLLPPLNL